MSCEPFGPLEGGTILNSEIIGSTIRDSAIDGGTVTGTVLSDVRLSDNIIIDDVVAQQIAAAVCPYIQPCLPPPGLSIQQYGGSVDESVGSSLTTTVVGVSRERLLGTPVVWLNIGGFIIPAYGIV